MIVMKFGGTSVGSAAAIRQVCGIVERALPRKPVLVVSAVSKVTDRLIDAANRARARDAAPDLLLDDLAGVHRSILADLGLPGDILDADLARLGEALRGVYLLRELTPRSLDYVVSYGEVLSSKIVAATLEARGVRARAWTGWEAGVVTDERHGEAAILSRTYALLKKNLGREVGRRVPVVTGFVGRTRAGERTTLGRGGSDYSAAIVGRALGAEEIQIWTDVTGILSCDPRIVPDAFPLRHLSFAEAAELAYFGAKVLHPKTVEPALDVGIPVRIVNTFEPDDPGTLVEKEPAPSGDARVVEGLAVKKGNLLANFTSTRMIDAKGYLAEIFGVLARHDVSVDCLATSEVSVSLTVAGRYEKSLRASLQELRHVARPQIHGGRAVIAVVGEGMKVHPGVAAEVFGVVFREGINVEMISQGASEMNLTFVVADGAADRALRALHDHFLRGRARAAVAGSAWLAGRRRTRTRARR
jgi:aspartate kinase